jgi:hypothetical protein
MGSSAPSQLRPGAIEVSLFNDIISTYGELTDQRTAGVQVETRRAVHLPTKEDEMKLRLIGAVTVALAPAVSPSSADWARAGRAPHQEGYFKPSNRAMRPPSPTPQPTTPGDVAGANAKACNPRTSRRVQVLPSSGE